MTENPNLPTELSFPVLIDPKLHPNDRNAIAFQNIKLLAIARVGHEAIMSLQVLMEIYEKCVGIFNQMKIPYNMFGWSWYDCLQRRKYPLNWFNLLRRTLSVKCAETRKLLIDFEELKKYIILILEPYLQQTHEYDTLEIMRETLDYIHIIPILQQQLGKNAKLCVLELKRVVAIQFVRKSLMVVKTLMREQKIDGSIVGEAIYRYSIKFQQAVEDQEDLACELAERNLSQNATDFEQRTQNEKYISQCCMNLYFVEIQRLRDRLIDMQSKYDKEYYELAANVNKLKTGAFQIEARYKFLKEQMQRYREEIQRIRLEESSKFSKSLTSLNTIKSSKSVKSIKSNKSTRSSKSRKSNRSKSSLGRRSKRLLGSPSTKKMRPKPNNGVSAPPSPPPATSEQQEILDIAADFAQKSKFKQIMKMKPKSPKT